MKPSARGKNSSEARATYDKIIEIFFYSRPVEELNEVVHPKFLGYGTAAHEFFKDRDALRNMAVMQAEQLRGTQFTLTRNPVIEKFLTDDSTFLILEDFELHMQDNDHTLQLRLSTILEKDSDKWVITHFHGSTPDKDVDKEEALPMEGLRKKNAELEAKIKERTRDLEIEAALEKVRSRTMAMRRSEELGEVATLLYKELIHLGVTSFFNCGFVIVKEKENLQEGWMTQAGGNFVEPLNLPCPGDAILKKRHRAWTKKIPVFSQKVSGKTLEKHLQYVAKYSTSDNQNRNIIPHMPDPCFFYCGNFSHGYLHIVSQEELGHEAEQILGQFSKVFEQTYTRFLDLQKAEAQAREAEIETALEKVRTASMAMQKGEELAKVISVVFAQLKALGIDSEGCALNLYDKEEGMDIWMSGFGEDVHPKSFHISYFDHPYYKRQLDDWKNEEKYQVMAFEGDLKKSYDKQTFSNKDFFELPEDIRKEFLAKERKLSSAAYMKYGMLEMVGDEALSDSQGDILSRFAKVFEQAYTRFLDLKKAEAQAREAEIELAIERIRSQAMAMNESSELLDIVVTMRNEFIRLGHEAHYFWHMMWLPDKYEKAMTSGDGKRIGMVMELPRHIHGDIKLLANWEKSTRPFVVYPMDAEAAIDYVDKMIKLGDFKQVDPNAPSHDEIKQIGGLTFIMARTTHGEIGYSLPGVVQQPPEENLNILQRFAGAFDLAHRRFLDLKKSEAQAREVEIELALERVRARTMAMQHSDELQEASFLLDEQVRKLGIQTWGCAFNIYREKDSIEWFGNEKGILPTYTIPRKGIFKKYYDLGQKGAQIHVEEIKGAKCISHYEYMSSLPVIGEVLKQLKETNGSYPEYQIDHVVYFKYGYLLFITTEQVPDSHDIFKRFAQVFEQTYTRFLDLQKAEAQAREAQIEAALERIRAKSMAMHSSDELSDVLEVLFEQFVILEINPVFAVLNLYDLENDTFTMRVTGKNGAKVIGTQTVKFSENEIWKDYGEKFRQGTPDMISDQFYPAEILPDVWEILKDIVHAVPEDVRPLPSDFPNGLYNIEGYCKFGTIGCNLNRPPTEEEKNIVIKFATEFGRVYRRFLDIQKAEAQAREAQIEAALEKVRSQSLAMHTTSEMQLVANAVYDQLRELGVVMDAVGMSGVIEEKKDYDVWIGGAPMGKALRIPYNKDTKVQRDYNKAIKERHDLFARTYKGKVKEEYINHLLTHGEFPKALKKKMVTSTAFSTSIAFAKNSGIQIARYTSEPYTDLENELLKRFSRVFEQAYIRFMDLQKAEKQAREAQIESSLERVRARSMAMHASDELNDVLSILFQQFDVLGIKPVTAFLSLFDIENNTFTYRSTSKAGNRMQTQQVVDLNSMEIWQEMAEKWKKDKQDSMEVIYYSPEVLPQLFDLFKETFSAMPEEERMTIADYPNGGYSMHGYCKFGYLGYNHTRLPTDEEKEILIKFATEFGRVYQRFLDIQKAEAQARESQIEAALEKVRSRSLAMQKPDELQEVVAVVGEKLQELGVILDSGGVVICTYFPDSKDVMHWTVTFDPAHPSVPYYLPYFDTPIWNETWASKWESDDDFFEKIFSFEDKNHFFHKAFEISDYKNLPEEHKKELLAVENHALSFAWQTNSALMIPSHNGKLLPEEHKTILKRFAKVFEQAYIRFMDLEKAEEQARESQIEHALEKVRSRTMAMQRSEELPEAANTLFLQVQSLGIPAWSAGYCIWESEDKKSASCNMSSEGELQKAFSLPTIGEGYNFYDPLKKGEKFYVEELGGDKLVKHYEFMRTLPTVGEILDDLLNAGLSLPTFQIFHILYFPQGYLMFITYEYVPEAHPVFKRFAKVFEQTYTRFMDLKKAEAQAREAQIESSLERVRSRSMAMHKSDEMLDLIVVVSEQLRQLNLKFDTVSFAKNDTEGAFTFWLSSRGQPQPLLMEVPPIDHPVINSVYEAKESGLSFISDIFSAAENKEWSKHIIKYSQLKEYPETVKDFILNAPGFARSSFFLKNIDLYVGNYKAVPYSDEENSIFRRFAKAFEQAYTRFLDLQKAENQAKEAEIEAALERVRSKTMAMHNSQDVGATVVTLFDEVQKLGLDDTIRCGIGILEGTEKMETWSANATPEGKVDLIVGMLDMNIHPMLSGLKKAWKQGGKAYTYEFKDDDVKEYYSKLNQEPEYPFNADLENLPDRVFHNSFFYSAGILFAFTENPLSEEALKILQRFAGVFGQTYRRYLDLLKAEKQAREAQIEASLERIRARAMAMHHTDELTDVLAVLFDQFDFLGINPVLTHLTLFDEANETFTLRITTGGKKRAIAEQLIDVNAVESWKTSFANWKKSELHAVDFIEYPPEVLPDVWELLDEVMSALPDENKIYPADFPDGLFTTQGHCKYGYIGFNHSRKATEEEVEIVIRFAKEFGRLYQRFLDIQKAELQARDALKQATLDRVRGQIASMRSTEDLDRITPLIWNELKALEIPFIRCGVFIINEPEKLVEAFLSAPDGHSLGVMKIPVHADKDTAATVAHWKKKQVYRTHWDKGQFLEFMQLMKDLEQVSNEKEYQGAEQPPESLHLHFVPFTQGMLYVGNVNPLEDEQIELIQTLADAFAIAYARYEDFVKLEKAKKQVEKTLEELKATQSQLVQSEKMASLGELTAGIAHEIQNPLNFVNNFSEVSVELLEEMLEEMSKGDLEEAKALLEDIKQNLDKIAHHGKRADGIVKGMLQHSRTSSGEKELTDLNVLADEYLRLAYHGLRAKDKTFNATLETHFDESIGKVNIVAQDIGRVILNLITNAFYVVKEKSTEALTQEGDNYQPTVTVSTKKSKEGVEISVKDNGNGIPDAIKEKIFEPFFTTKPTGQGTGLGLSMSYDIVTKGHGGNLKVETEEGVGTEFTILIKVA